MRDLNFDNLGDLIIENGCLDTDPPNDTVQSIANRLRCTILKALPVFIENFKSEFRGKRILDAFSLENQVEDFLISNLIEVYPTDPDLDLLKCVCFYLNEELLIYFYFIDDLGNKYLVFKDNIEF